MTEEPADDFTPIGGVAPSQSLLEKWAPASHWNLEEGVCLALGIDPNAAIKMHVYGFDEWRLPDDALNLIELIRKATLGGYPMPPGNPSEFVSWAQEPGIHFSDQWLDALKDHGCPPGHDALSSLYSSDSRTEPLRRLISEDEIRADLIERWARLPSWTHDEGLALSFKKAPHWLESEPSASHHVPRSDMDRRKDFLQRSLVRNELAENPTPAEFVLWAEKCGFPFHNEWYAAVPELAGTPNDQKERQDQEQLGTRERSTLLKLVIGMAIKGYAYDPNAKRSSTPNEIADDLAKLGIEITQETILKKLREGAGFLPGDLEDE